MKHRILPTLTLLGALAVPTSALADTVGGNPAQGAPGQTFNCTDHDTGLVQPCTFTVDTINGVEVHVPAGKVITGYTGYFDADSQIGLRLMKRNADGTYTSDGESGYTYAGGGVEHFDTNIPVPAGDHTIALDVYSGGVGATANPNSRIFASKDVFYKGQTDAPGDAANFDVQFSVDYGDPAPDPTPVPTSTSTATPDPGSDDPKPGFTIEPKAILDADGRSIDVFASNELTKEVSGKLTLKVGSKSYKPGEIYKFDYHSKEDLSAGIGGAALKKLLRTGRLTGVVTAKTDGGTFTQKVSIVRGGSSKYDGTYRGDGPLIIVVKNGVITTVDETLNCFSTANGGSVMRTMGTGKGFPALVAKDGSFDHKASDGADSFTYKGKLSLHGPSKGYLSLWYSTFDLDPVSNKFRALQYFQADNFTVTKSK